MIDKYYNIYVIKYKWICFSIKNNKIIILSILMGFFDFFFGKKKEPEKKPEPQQPKPQ